MFQNSLLFGEMRVLRELFEIPVEIDEAQIALDAEKSEKAKLAEEARQAKRNTGLKEIHEKLAECASKEAAETKNPETPAAR